MANSSGSDGGISWSICRRVVKSAVFINLFMSLPLIKGHGCKNSNGIVHVLP